MTVQPALDGTIPNPPRQRADDYETWLIEAPAGTTGHDLAKPYTECSDTDCHREGRKRGMCGMHYQRWKAESRRAGLPLPPAPPRPTWSADLTGDRPYDHQYREATKRRIAERSVVDPESGCWHWQKAIDKDGYGVCGAPRRNSAHRTAYLAFIGPIPAGMVIDHRCHSADATCPGGNACRHRRCVNPAHLDLVTPGENTQRGTSPSALNARKTHCHRGHEFTPENTYVTSTGRSCRACQRLAVAAYRNRKKRSQG